MDKSGCGIGLQEMRAVTWVDRTDLNIMFQLPVFREAAEGMAFILGTCW